MIDFSQVLRRSAKGPNKKEGWEFNVRLTPKASHTKIGDISFDTQGQAYLKIYVTAVPEDNKANKALIALLSKTFHLPKSSFYIISGHTDRQKVIWFEGDLSL
ncbi:MAG: DUF167 domain-containing protein [Alphaproteobacteria bacterium]|jgi:uncharacterized protein YggU (UPF0235/DUF167 family)|nr:DUF167 domain-containing protein [Alphaproteobacteria bacterium]